MIESPISFNSLFWECDNFSVIVSGDSFEYFEYHNYPDALKKFKELKGKNHCYVQLVMHRILEEQGVTNNGNVDE